jgi:hypothetical protein
MPAPGQAAVAVQTLVFPWPLLRAWLEGQAYFSCLPGCCYGDGGGDAKQSIRAG